MHTQTHAHTQAHTHRHTHAHKQRRVHAYTRTHARPKILYILFITSSFHVRLVDQIDVCDVINVM